MFDVMSQARNAMESYSSKLKIISANIVNMSVPGYKKMGASFQDIFSKLISPGTAAFSSDMNGGINPEQIGGTVSIASTFLDFSVGPETQGGNLDMKINSGKNFFIVSNDGGNSFLYTKAGNFQVTADKKVYTKNGMQVYGFRRTGGSSALELVPIDLSNVSYSDETKLTWDESGVLRDSLDTTTSVYGKELPFQIALASFRNPSGLLMRDGTTFSPSASSGQAEGPTAPISGMIKPRYMEQANVDYPSEIVDSLETQRALDATMTVIRMANDTITQFINKLSG